MIKRLAVTLTVATVLCGALLVSTVRAGGPSQFPMDITASSSTAAPDGVSKITFTVFIYGYYCAPDNSISETPATCSDGSASVKKAQSNHQIGIYTSGSGNIFGGTQTETNGVRYVVSGADGKAQFTLASTVAGQKTLQFTDVVRNSPYVGAPSKTVTFAAPAPTPAPPKTTTTTSSTPSVQTTQQAAAPATPASSGFEINGQTLANTEKPTVEQDKSFVLKGTTVPNGVVKLYIFSTPREATVTADASGNWSYEVKDLEPGSHHVEAEVTDPKTQKTSERKTLAEFTIAAAPVAMAPVAASMQSTGASNKKFIALGVAVAVLSLVAAAVWLLIRYNKKHHAAVAANDVKTIVPQEAETGADEAASPAPVDENPLTDRDAGSTEENSSNEQPKI